jgi:hypothetical protein
LYAHMNNKTIKKRERECMWGGVVVRVRKLWSNFSQEYRCTNP